MLAQNRYLSFCQRTNIIPFPTSIHVLCSFVAVLGSQGLKHQSVKKYLSAIRHAQISAGFPDPFKNTDLSKLEFILKDLKRQQAYQGTPSKTCLPVTPDILGRLKRLWDSRASDPEIAMLWATCTLGVFGFLQCGEFICPSGQTYDPSCHLSLSDIAIDSTSNPRLMRVTAEQDRQGVDIYLGTTNTALCPVMAMLAYLAIRSQSPGPLSLRMYTVPVPIAPQGRFLESSQVLKRQTGVLNSLEKKFTFWHSSVGTRLRVHV